MFFTLLTFIKPVNS